MKHGMSRSHVIWANDMRCDLSWPHITVDMLAVTFVAKPDHVATCALFVAA